MLSYFIIILLTNISNAKPLVIPVAENTYVTVNELKDLKIYLLSIIALAAFNFLKWIASLFWGDQKELKDRVKTLETLPDKMDALLRSVARIENAQLTEGEVRKITRDEMSYADAVKRRGN